MAAKGGIALKFLQWFIRGIQFCCAAVILALFSYFLATLHNHKIDIATWIRAVEGISGIAVVYTLVGLLLLCCLAGHPFTSGIAMTLDLAFIGGFIYIAWMTRGGATSCNGYVSTPFGAGDADNHPSSNEDGFTSLPSLRQACKMQTACFAVAIVAIIFFIFSILVELALIRHRRRESRFGPSPANNYTSGSGKRGGGLFGRFRRNKSGAAHNHNALPTHTAPNEVRDSYATETTAVGQEPAYNKYGESGYAHTGTAGTTGTTGVTGNGYGHTGYPNAGTTGTHAPHDYRYNDGTYDRV